MMNTMKNLTTKPTFCPIYDFISENDRINILKELKSLDNMYWYKNEYRNCYILPVRNGGGEVIREKTNYHDKKFFYTSVVHENCPTLLKICDKIFDKIIKDESRISILKTYNFEELNYHIDTKLEEVNENIYKFRYVIDGNVDDLFFINKNLEKINVPNTSRMYVMDGGNLHGMKNNSGKTKYTLCFGSPWKGKSLCFSDTLYDIQNSFKIENPKIKKEWLDKRFENK